jgi:hypothetical protein
MATIWYSALSSRCREINSVHGPLKGFDENPESNWTGRTPPRDKVFVDCSPSGLSSPAPLGHRLHVRQDEAALWPGRHDSPINAEILLRHRVGHTVHEECRRLFEQGNSDLLAGTAMGCEVIAASLRDEVEGAAVPIAEALRLKGPRVGPESLVAVRSIHVQHDPCA